MENKLKGDFIRSFLYLYFEEEINLFDLENDIIPKGQNIYEKTILLTSEDPIGLDFIKHRDENHEYIQNIINACFRFTQLTDMNDNKINCLAALERTILIINKNKINTAEYYKGLYAYLNYITDTITIKKYTNIIKDKSYKDLLEDKNQAIKKSIIETVKELPDNTVQRLNNEIEQINKNIQELLREIQNQKENLIDLYGKQVIAQLNSTNLMENLINFLDKCKLVVGYSSASNLPNWYKIRVITDWLPVDYTYGDAALEKMTRNNNDLAKNKNIDILINALSNRDKYEILTAPSIIELTYNPQRNELNWTMNTLQDYVNNNCRLHNLFTNNPTYDLYKLILNRRLTNRHYFQYSCLGSFNADLAQAQATVNPIRLVSTLLQYLGTINITDVAGNNWLKQTHLIRNKQNNKYFLYDSLSGDILIQDKNIIKKLHLKDIYTDTFVKEI